MAGPGWVGRLGRRRAVPVACSGHAVAKSQRGVGAGFRAVYFFRSGGRTFRSRGGSARARRCSSGRVVPGVRPGSSTSRGASIGAVLLGRQPPDPRYSRLADRQRAPARDPDPPSSGGNARRRRSRPRAPLHDQDPRGASGQSTARGRKDSRRAPRGSGCVRRNAGRRNGVASRKQWPPLLRPEPRHLPTSGMHGSTRNSKTATEYRSPGR